MTKFPYLPEASALPDAHDPARAEPWMERWRATAAAAPDPAVRDFAPSLAQSPEGQRLLQTIFANSPFLSHCLIADIGLLAAVLNLGPGGVLKNVLGTVKSTAAAAGDQAELMRSLRVRAEESRVGREGVRTCRYRWSPK